MTTIGERYVEQLSTTAETLRRRFVSYYDGLWIVGQRIGRASKRIIEIAEPASLDLKDYVTSALGQTEPISRLTKDWRNTLVETYLGISILMTGLAYGQLAGVYSLSSIMNRIFDGYVEFGLLWLLPIYSWLHIRKEAALDDMERRTSLFGLALSMGAIAGHLWPSTISLAPAIHFIPPLVFALLIDNEIIRTPLVELDRIQFFALGSAAATTISILAGVIPLGYISPAVLLSTIVHTAFFVLHFQLACQTEKTFAVGETQFVYIVAIFAVQMLFTVFFGGNPLNPQVVIHPSRI